MKNKPYAKADDSLENTQEILRRMTVLLNQGEIIDSKLELLLKEITSWREANRIWEK